MDHSRKIQIPSFKARILKILAGLIAIAPISSVVSAADTVTLRLDFLPQGYHAPLFYGVAKGFYKDQGIDLEIADGKGSNASLQSVAAGNDMIVLANYGTMAQSTTQGMPLIAIGGLIQKLPDGILSLKGSGITKPKDLEGKAGAIPATSAVFKIFPAFASAAGVDLSKIKIVQMGPGATNAALLQGQVDFTTGWAFTQGVQIGQHKPLEPPMLMADYGINILSVGFVVKSDTAASKGDILKRFMAATAKSYEDGLKNPEASIQAMFDARPQADKESALGQLKLFPSYLQTDRSKGRPFGWTSKEDWVQTVDILKKYFDVTATIDVDKIYTNQFVPAP